MIILITPTGSRQAQINLCKLWMQRQTYKGEVAWILVDDSYPRTIENVTRQGWDVIKIYPEPRWTTGMNTQARNIAAGVNEALKRYKDIEAIFIIEDDDYYKPIYLDEMMFRLNGFDLIGEMRTIYYNVMNRQYVTNANTIHASLFQTALTLKALPQLETAFQSKFIDCVLWRNVPNRYIFQADNLAVGIKGMPGRGGIGAGHRQTRNMINDNYLSHLLKLIGTDAELYEKFYKK